MLSHKTILSGDYSGQIFAVTQVFRFRACLHGGGGPQVREINHLVGVTRLSIESLIWSPHPSCKRNQIKMRDEMGRRVTLPKHVTSPTWGTHNHVNRTRALQGLSCIEQ